MTLLTVNETAQRLRCHPETIRRMVRAGELDAAYVGGKYLIDEGWAAAWAAWVGR